MNEDYLLTASPLRHLQQLLTIVIFNHPFSINMFRKKAKYTKQNSQKTAGQCAKQ